LHYCILTDAVEEIEEMDSLQFPPLEDADVPKDDVLDFDLRSKKEFFVRWRAGLDGFLFPIVSVALSVSSVLLIDTEVVEARLTRVEEEEEEGIVMGDGGIDVVLSSSTFG
jgi:hypothetical protein